MSGDGEVTLQREGPVAHVTFDRPAARNAMTWAMYGQLDEICTDLAADRDLRAVVFRGAGGRSFVAGSDIAQFRDFTCGEDGLEYERSMDRHMARLLAIPVPTVAAIEGWAVGGGLSIAACCDLRVATRGTKLGIPIARTVGNCLSMASYRRLVDGIGAASSKRMLMLGEFLTAEEALASGFLVRVVKPDELDREIEAIVDRLLGNAPITLRVTKEAIRRIQTGEDGDGADLIAETYGSDDFRHGVAAFVNKEPPDWSGR
ncbi:enoyl-CoA hydratase [Rhodobacteraceae bacterium 2CG4]|uniref:Enoyl-CoA hydratase n=1 Tax=Halovulum marinum TaxID=2662447 RepID=A0A6L5YYG2_9RHOB|nr:enoyl-CoA hydratase/isomerase family protein [Halovulum marinum]MSU89343.1 enoyl-CoA hydratase [Halovulum marinum]